MGRLPEATKGAASRAWVVFCTLVVKFGAMGERLWGHRGSRRPALATEDIASIS